MTVRSVDKQGRLGILGGTFDPIHLGHLASARACARAFDLEQVLLLLSARPPHKDERAYAEIDQRLAMLRLAVGDDPVLRVCDLEVRRPGPSYTSETLADLNRSYAKHCLYLILGEDAYDEINTWHRPDLLLERANLIVTSRPGSVLSGPRKAILPPVAAHEACCYDPAIKGYVHTSGHRLIEYDLASLDVSASEIRRRAKTGEALDSLTGSAVAAYIDSHGLYGATPTNRV